MYIKLRYIGHAKYTSIGLQKGRPGWKAMMLEYSRGIHSFMHSFIITSKQHNTKIHTVSTHIGLLQGGPKNLAPFFLYALTLPNINRLSKLFHSQNQDKICNNSVAKDPTTPQVCRYTTLWNVSVIKATTENKTTSVTTHFKKLTTGNIVFIVSVIV